LAVTILQTSHHSGSKLWHMLAAYVNMQDALNCTTDKHYHDSSRQSEPHDIHFTSKYCYWHSFCGVVTSSLRSVVILLNFPILLLELLQNLKSNIRKT